jgi:hypothetical protein
MDGWTAFLALKTANCAPLPDSSRFCRHSWRAWQRSLINSSWCMYLTCDNACGVFDFVLPEVFCPWDCRFAGLEPTRSFPAGEQRIKTKKRSMPLRLFHSRGVPAPSNLRKIRLRLHAPHESVAAAECFVSARMAPPHPARLVAVGEAALDKLAPPPQWTLAVLARARSRFCYTTCCCSPLPCQCRRPFCFFSGISVRPS